MLYILWVSTDVWGHVSITVLSHSASTALQILCALPLRPCLPLVFSTLLSTSLCIRGITLTRLYPERFPISLKRLSLTSHFRVVYRSVS